MANTASDIQTAMNDSILEPQSASNDAGSVTMPSIYNQLLYLKWLKQQEQQAANVPGIKTRRIINGNSRGV